MRWAVVASLVSPCSPVVMLILADSACEPLSNAEGILSGQVQHIP